MATNPRAGSEHPLVAGAPVRLSPLVRRVLAPNAGPFTGPGTNSYLVGRGDVAVIDPGPEDPRHIGALLGALAPGERITAIMCTHTHRDHSPGAKVLKGITGAPVIGCAALMVESSSYDLDYRPDRVLADGDTIEGSAWRLEAVATPGHTSNQLCFALDTERTLFSGDHVMGWSTTVVVPPDGNMGEYVRSLERLGARDDHLYHSGHGQPVSDPQRVVRALAGHRRAREAQLVSLLEELPMTIEELVARMYPAIEPRLAGAAGQTVLAHLIDVERRGLVRRDGRYWALA